MFLLNEQISRDDLKKHMKELYNYCVQHLKGIDRNPKVFLKSDSSNAEDIFGKTGFYNPDTEEIYLFVSDRHPKDVLRSFAHELVHHDQNCRGDTSSLNMDLTSKDPAYASHDEGLKIQRRGENIMSESKTAVDVLLEKVIKKLTQESVKMTSAEKEKEKEVKKAISDKEMKKRYGKKAKGVETAIAKKIAKKVAEGSKMPMKTDAEDVDGDGNTDEKVPAFLDKGEVKKKKKDGKVPPQLQKFVKAKEEKTNESLNESNPYPKLFEKKERLFQDRMNQHEEILYQEMLKLAIKK